MIQEYQLSPNIMTFGTLAFRCNNISYLKEYLNDLKVSFFKQLF
jgi:hypothetical protein